MLGSLISGGLGLLGGLFSSNKEAKRQKLFAQTGIQWKVNDSLQAGIHPLFGLGANTAQYSPTNIVGDNIARAGQDIGGAIDKMRTVPQRVNAFDARMQNLQLRRGELENILLESQITRERQTPTPAPPQLTGDPALIPGQGDTRIVPLPPGADPKRRLKIGLTTIDPPSSSSPASKIEDEFGDNFAVDLINGVRTIANVDRPMTEDAKRYIEQRAQVWANWLARNGQVPGRYQALSTYKWKKPRRKQFYDRVPQRNSSGW